MYCVACGTLLPNKAQFCPRCGKPNGPEEIAPQPSSSEPATEGDSDASLSLPRSESDAMENGTASSARNGVEEARQFVGENLGADSFSPAPSAATVTQEAKSAARYANAFSIPLGVGALICLVLGAVQGFIPIFLIEGFAFAGLAWLCAAKWPLSKSLHSIVFVSTLLLAGVVGVTLDQDTFGPRYRYLSQGSAQIRVDEKAGRTDRLGNSGWYPVSYDKEAQEVPGNGIVPPISLTNGSWTSLFGGGKICFTAANSTDYILSKITIAVQTQKKSGAAQGDAGSSDKSTGAYSNAFGQPTVLESLSGGFIGTGDTALVCASSPRDLSSDETWSYTDVHAYGWKR